MKNRTTALTVARGMLTGLAALTLALSGCSTTSETTTQPSDTESTGSEFSQGETPKSDQGAVKAPSLDLGTAYFDYDRAEVRSDMREVLRRNAESLKGDDRVAVIEGYCDERGSEEYNLALGQRRADAARKYMTALGLDGSDLKTVSYGEAKPAVRGHDEAAWRWNRRAEFKVRD
jgi:peptidoglycan-associated lipoprotein